MKIAVLGGSFNPIHIGHLALADSVCVDKGYDKVIFIPTFIAPHKNFSDIENVTTEDRLNMVRLACESDSRFLVDSCEIDRGGTSYTFDTICFLEQKYKDVLDEKIGLIMGDDLLPGFHLWHKAEEIAKKCTLILAKRPQGEKTDVKSMHENTAKGDYGKVAHATVDENGKVIFDVKSEPLFSNAVFLSNPELKLSSTDIRNRIACHKAFKYLVPDSVFKYIIESNIYENNK